MLYEEAIAIYSKNRMKHKNTLCGKNVELFNIKAEGSYSYHYALRDLYL
jgi:hypothetical protein